MGYEMKDLRKEDLSLYLYIKDVILRDFVETEEYVTLRLLPNYTGSYVYECSIEEDVSPSPTDYGRGWVYFDSPDNSLSCEPFTTLSGFNGDGAVAYGTPEQSNMVVVYETTVSGLSVVDWKDYIIDYVDGRIVSTRRLNSPKITYSWNYISLVDEWASVVAAAPPVVVVDVSGTDKSGFQLGGGKKVARKVDLHVFGNNAAERNDIVEALYDGLYNRSCPLYSFPSGSVLDYDGTFYGRRDLTDRISIQLIN